MCIVHKRSTQSVCLQVKDLAAVSLNKPVKVFINENTDTALGLRQEFIRIRANREGDREAIVAGIHGLYTTDHPLRVEST